MCFHTFPAIGGLSFPFSRNDAEARAEKLARSSSSFTKLCISRFDSPASATDSFVSMKHPAALVGSWMALLLCGCAHQDVLAETRLGIALEYSGTSPDHPQSRKFLGGLPTNASCHAIAWQLTFLTHRNRLWPDDGSQGDQRAVHHRPQPDSHGRVSQSPGGKTLNSEVRNPRSERNPKPEGPSEANQLGSTFSSGGAETFSTFGFRPSFGVREFGITLPSGEFYCGQDMVLQVYGDK